MLKKLTMAAFLCVAALCGSVMAAEDGFVSLFNGKDLDGWTVRGGSAKYQVEDGCIIGTCVPDTPHNTFLCTNKDYANFILKLEFKFLESGNSGVQIRSHYRQSDENAPQLTYGYQCELAEYPALGQIYDEGRRGFKHGRTFLDDQLTIDEAKKEAFATYKKGEWNEVEIQCVGPSIRTWINGKPVANILDPVDACGYIGLQIHAGKSGKMAWRNVRIKELPASEWKPFFVKGDDGAWKLDGCYYFVPECWKFNENGELVGSHSRTEVRDGLVVSEKNFDDFAVRVDYRFIAGNSALYYRAEEVKTSWLLRGNQNEIAGNNKDSALWHTAGAPGDPPGRGWVASNDEYIAKVRNANGEWNNLCAIAIGDRECHLLNNFRTIDIVDPLCEKTGKFGLQLHGGADAEMVFKNFEYMVITPEMRALIER
ncbi:MAG: DUF1080 domain-containing protein [Planctomycetia bacterium]|nr:DUF1080 domain-containing protein [Planctomycetia bacterium]